jgi:CO/xanthine dehydrogenase Mo-binding subunit
MLQVAADELEADAEDLETDGTGFIAVKGAAARKIHISDVALAAHFKQGRTISGRGIFLKERSYPDPETGKMDPDSCQAHACTVADVEVDDETGVIEVLSLHNAYEIGRALNPALATQQVEGGAWMGVSHALFESTEPGYPASRAHGPIDFSEYLMPGPAESPAQTSILLERPSDDGPFGAKGIGEMTANAPIPAIANAVYDAIGVRLTVMPFTPESVLRGLDELRAGIGAP